MVQLLGRAESVKDFVRKGCQQGSTEIHLSSGSDRPIIITRQMNSEDGTSKWLLNSRPHSNPALITSPVQWRP